MIRPRAKFFLIRQSVLTFVLTFRIRTGIADGRGVGIEFSAETAVSAVDRFDSFLLFLLGVEGFAECVPKSKSKQKILKMILKI